MVEILQASICSAIWMDTWDKDKRGKRYATQRPAVAAGGSGHENIIVIAFSACNVPLRIH